VNKEQVKARMAELTEPINQQIMMCDNEQEMLMMACVMVQHSHTIFCTILGEKGARVMYEDLF
jgi:hypothetical protein